MSFTSVEIAKMKDEGLQKLYRDNHVEDYPVFKSLIEQAVQNGQAGDILLYLRGLNDTARGLYAIQGLMNLYNGEQSKLDKAQKFISGLREGELTPRQAYNRVVDLLYGDEVAEGETIPALNAPQKLLNAGKENSETKSRKKFDIGLQELSKQRRP